MRAPEPLAAQILAALRLTLPPYLVSRLALGVTAAIANRRLPYGPLPDPSGAGRPGPAGIPFQSGLPAADARAPAFGDLSLGPTAADPGLASPLAASTEEEIAGLLKQGDDARAGGDRQQAIEIWSRIFLLDINHADAASRIEKTRAGMAQENRRAASAAAVPPAAPAASAPPLPSPHDLSMVVATGDVLAEEMDQSGPPGKRSWGPRPKSRPTRQSSASASPCSYSGRRRHSAPAWSCRSPEPRSPLRP